MHVGALPIPASPGCDKADLNGEDVEMCKYTGA